MNSLKTIWSNHSPVIMTVASVVGVGVTVYTTANATMKAERLIQEEENRLKWDTIEHEHPRDTLTNREKFDLVWRLYIPPTVASLATIGCIITLHQTGARQAAAASALYSVTERAFSDYQKKVVEHIGEKKEQTVRDEVAQDRVNNEPPQPNSIFDTPHGNVLFKDSFSGRYFYNDVEHVRKAQNDINHQVLTEGFISLSELYDRLGLPGTKTSDDIGWNLDSQLDFHITTTLTENNEPCIYLDYDVYPITGFCRLV